MFTYTKARSDTGYSDGEVQIEWINSWTLEELPPEEPDYVRLRLKLSTHSFWTYPASYTAYAGDTASCGGETVTIRPYGRAGYSYDTELRLPAAWAGQQVRFTVAWKRVDLLLDVTPAAPATLTAAGDTFGSPVTLTIHRPLPDVMCSLSVSCLGRSETLLSLSTADSAVWTPALETFAPLLTDSDSAEAFFYLESFSRGQRVGDQTRPVTLTLPASLRPVPEAGWLRVAAYNTGAAAPFTCFIRGHSRAEAFFDASKVSVAGLYGATVAGFSLTAGGETVTASPYRSGVLTGPTELIAAVIDSRGRRAEERVTVSPLDYSPPALGEITVFRCREDGTADENGSAVSVSAQLHLCDLAGENSGAAEAAVRMPPGAFGAAQALPCVLTGLSPDRSCEVILRATDRFGGTAQALRLLPTRRWAMKFRPDGEGVAFGKAPESVRALELPADWELLFGAAAWWERIFPPGAVVLGACPPVGVWTEIPGGLAGQSAWTRNESE